MIRLAQNTLRPGQVRVGHVVDGDRDKLPAQVGVLTIDYQGQVELALPYLVSDSDEQNPQYTKTRQWVEEPHRGTPPCLHFFDQDGWVTLFDLEWAGYHNTNNGSGTGRLHARRAVFARARSIENTYRLTQFISTIDGLSDFSNFSPLEFVHGDPTSREQTVRLKEEEVFGWERGNFRYQISSSYRLRWGSEFELKDAPPLLITTSRSDASVEDHLEAHRAVRALLILIYGRRLSWRNHQIVSDSFPEWGWREPTENSIPTAIILAETSADHFARAISEISRVKTMLQRSDLDPSQLEHWVELYADERLRRAIEPAVEVFNGATAFIEPQLMMLTISLEYFGYWYGYDRFKTGERYWSAKLIQEAINATGLKLASVGSSIGIANAIARVNNDLKHPDRERNPSPDELHGLVLLAKTFARAQVYELLQVHDSVKDDAFKYELSREVSGFFRATGIRIADDGSFA